MLTITQANPKNAWKCAVVMHTEKSRLKTGVFAAAPQNVYLDY